MGGDLIKVDDSILMSVKKLLGMDPEEFDQYDERSYMNIIIKYMNNSKIDSNIIPLLESIDFKPTVDMFYCIPMIIYILEASIKKLMN